MMKIHALALLALFATPATMAACEIDVQVGDNLEFSQDTIQVESGCETVTINLEHTGQVPAAAMGHNWVLSEAADFEAVARAGAATSLEQDYLPPDDDRVIAATPVIGGGESTSVSFSIADLDPAKDYTFFCSFPGHWTAMNGSFEIV